MKEQLSALFVLREQLDLVDAGGSFTLSPEEMAALTELAYVGDSSAPTIPSGTPLEAWPGAPCEQK